MKSHSFITLEDIAKRSNVSAVTVSKALHGHPDISPETKNRIKKITEQLGYIPNYYARSISSNHSKTIGVIVPKIAHYFFSPVIETIYDEAYKNGYEIILTISQESAQRERKHIETLLSMRVDGIMVSVTQETKDGSVFQRAKQLGVPLTFFDRVMNETGFNKVVADDFKGAFTATEQAIRVGYRKIGHLSGYKHTCIGKNRLMGYKAALKKHGLFISTEQILECGFGEVDGYQGFRKWYESKKIPECIFCVTFPVAFGVYRAAAELGLKIPRDFDIISYGNSTLNEFLSPSLSYVEQPTTELGRTALHLTINSINKKNKFVSQTITLPTQLILRDTCVGARNQTVRSDSESFSNVSAYV